MCNCCKYGPVAQGCNFCWLDKILHSPLTWILVICVAILVLLLAIKVISKDRYRRFLIKQIDNQFKIEVADKEFETIFDDIENQLTERITPLVTKDNEGKYIVDTEKVTNILDEIKASIKNKMKEKNDLHKLYLSKLSDSFGD